MERRQALEHSDGGKSCESRRENRLRSRQSLPTFRREGRVAVEKHGQGSRKAVQNRRRRRFATAREAPKPDKSGVKGEF